MNTLTFDAENQAIVNEAVNAVIFDQNTTNTTLIFNKVVNVEEQVYYSHLWKIVSGVNYALTLEFTNNTSESKEYF